MKYGIFSASVIGLGETRDFVRALLRADFIGSKALMIACTENLMAKWWHSIFQKITTYYFDLWLKPLSPNGLVPISFASLLQFNRTYS